MRERHDPRVIEQAPLREVGDIGVQLPRIQSLQHRLLIHDARAGKIKQRRGLFHELQPRGIHEPPRLIVQGHMHRDRIRAGKEIFERERLLDIR